MNFSYWERKSFIGLTDVIVVGSGITGLSTAIHLKKMQAKLTIKILERGMMPWGASSKNAGFACFGSLGEIISDVKHSSLDEILELIRFRNEGLALLTKLLGEKAIDLQRLGGFELFQENQRESYVHCLDRMDEFNRLLKNEFGSNTYEKSHVDFGFKGVIGIIKNNFEGQIDTGKMMKAYLSLAKSYGIEIINGAEVVNLTESNKVQLTLRDGLVIESQHVIVCANGFANQLLKEDVQPARAQVIITKPIAELPFEGTFHYDEGYYYFRNINNRVLFGGGRNLDFSGETTSVMETTTQITDELKRLLKEVILPNTPHEVDYSWAGIMGVGKQKQAIIKNISKHISCAVRMGGMGVAIGSLVGKKAAEMYVANHS